MHFKTLLAITLAILCGGCAATKGTEIHRSSSASSNAFAKRLAEHGVLTFRSYNGNKYGMDSDVALVLSSNGDAGMLEWGLSGEGYRGKFHIHEDGCVICWFEEARDNWPAMAITEEGGALILRPIYPPNGWRAPRTGASTLPAEGNFWQFRELRGKDEAGVLETARKWIDLAP